MTQRVDYTQMPLADNSPLRFILEGTANLHGEAWYEQS